MRRLCLFMLVVLLSSCTAIPTEGPVEEVPLSANPAGIDIAPEPPEAGATPSRVIEGFLLAMTDPEGDYAIAREYLTQEAAQRWQPDEAVVYDGSVSGDTDSAQIEGTQVGRLDASGHFSLNPGPLDVPLDLVQVNDQWRISSPPEGLLLSRYLFQRYYSTATIYFMSRAGQHVVPELIHLPNARLTPQAVVNSLLRGPTAGLRTTATTAVPEGVTLGNDGASVNSDGVVTVDLHGLDNRLSDDARRRLGAQVLWSLTSIERVTGLILTSDGASFALPGANAEGVLELATQQGYQVLSRASTVDLFGIREGRPGRLNSTNTFLTWANPGKAVSDLAVSSDATVGALITTDRTTILLGAPEGTWSQLSPGYTNLRSPQFVGDSLWLLGDNQGQTSLLSVDSGGVVRNVATALPDGARLSDFAVSPTEARIAMIVDVGGRTQLGVATVRPGPLPRLGDWQALPLTASSGTTLTNYASLAWPDETAVAVIARAGEPTSVFTAEIDGSAVEDLGSVSFRPVDVTAMARIGGGSLAIRTDSGATWRYEPRTRWSLATEELSAVAYAS